MRNLNNRATPKRKNKTPPRPLIRLTPTAYRFGQYLAVMVLAGIAIINKIDNPEVWGFLAGTLALLIGKSSQWILAGHCG